MGGALPIWAGVGMNGAPGVGVHSLYGLTGFYFHFCDPYVRPNSIFVIPIFVIFRF